VRRWGHKRKENFFFSRIASESQREWGNEGGKQTAKATKSENLNSVEAKW